VIKELQEVTLSGIEEERSEEEKQGDEEQEKKGDEEHDKEGEVRIREEEGEDTRKPRAGRIPTAPTKKELEEHLPLHVPYKEWCPICVAGEGIHDQARKTAEADKDKLGITISMDYCFLSSSEDVEQDPKVLILHDDRLGAIWALCVKAKGPSPEVVTWVMNKLEEAGYRGVELSLKTDQEESIMALKRAIAARRHTRTSMIESKVRVPKSNPIGGQGCPKVERTDS
jgi:hypothetical protein